MRKGSLTFWRKRYLCLVLGGLGAACSKLAFAGAIESDVQTPDFPANENVVANSLNLKLSIKLGAVTVPANKRNRVSPFQGLDAPLRLDFALGRTVTALRLGDLPVLAATKHQGLIEVAANQPVDPEDPVPYDPPPAGQPARGALGRENRVAIPKPKADTSGLPDLSGESWQLAPIRWAGNTTTSGNHFQASDGGKSLTILNNLNIQANSFIVAPYIAQWSGLLGASSTGSKFTPTTGAANRSDSSSFNFGGSVDVFPQSRFPFSANLSRATSQSRSAEISSPSTSTSLGARQSYRTEDGRDNYALNFSRNGITSGLANSSVKSAVTNAGGSFSTTREFPFEHMLEGNHNINASFSGSNAATDPTTTAGGGTSAQDSKQMSFNVNHGWNVHEDLSISNLFTFARTRANMYQGNALTQNAATVLLGSSSFTWRPIEDLPLTLTGGGNFSRTQTSNNNTTNDLNNLSGFVATNYRFNNNLSASGNVSITSIQTAGTRTVTNLQNGSVSYAGDPLTISGWIYGWGTGGGVSRSASSNGGNEIGTNVSANHTLARSFILSEMASLNLTAGQNLTRTTAALGPTTSFGNNVGAAFRAAYGEKLTANLSANVIVTASDGVGGRNQFKSANLMGGAAYQISSRASVTANSNLSWTQSVITNTTNQILNGVTINSNDPVMAGSFSLGYTHQSPFSIRNLNYSGYLSRQQSFSNQNVAGGTGFTSDNGSTSLQQLVDYRLGRLVFRLSHSWIDQSGRKSASLFGSVTREFDGFFDGRW